MALLTETEWRLLTKLYAAGKTGIEYAGGAYGGAEGAGESYRALQTLRAHNPALAREITRPDPRNNTTRYLIMITDAGTRFYERNRRRYRVFYPV